MFAICLPKIEVIKFNQNRTNKLIEDFISEIYYKHFKQFESWNNLNEIETNDSEILDFFIIIELVYIIIPIIIIMII